MNVAVFLSQYDVAGKYTEVTERLARGLARGKHTLLFGGTDEGLMHVIADGVHTNGGRVISVIRSAIRQKSYPHADDTVLVEDSQEMNVGLIERADIIVVLAGGIGTLNELTAVIRRVKNAEGGKPTVVVNTDGFYDAFRAQLERMRQEGFIRPDVMDSTHFVATPEEAMRYIEGHGN